MYIQFIIALFSYLVSPDWELTLAKEVLSNQDSVDFNLVYITKDCPCHKQLYKLVSKSSILSTAGFEDTTYWKKELKRAKYSLETDDKKRVAIRVYLAGKKGFGDFTITWLYLDTKNTSLNAFGPDEDSEIVLKFDTVTFNNVIRECLN